MFEVIDEAENLEDLNEKERYWITYYQSTNKDIGYNIDSGGRNGGVKSKETKRKIGDTTLEKWKNPIIAQKMRAGLQKGAETMKKNAKSYPFTCPVCGKTFFYMKHIADAKKFCSLECAGKGGNWKKGVERSADENRKRNLKRKEPIKKEIIQWVTENSDIVQTCPYNHITTTLSGIFNIMEKHNIKDIRSIFICFNVKNRKELLDKLKTYTSKENVC